MKVMNKMIVMKRGRNLGLVFAQVPSCHICHTVSLERCDSVTLCITKVFIIIFHLSHCHKYKEVLWKKQRGKEVYKIIILALCGAVML